MALSKPSTPTASVRAITSVSRDCRAIERRLDLADHFGCRHQPLLVEVAAALGKGLVLELDRVGAGAFEQPHGARDIERIAVAGIGIDDQIGGNPVADRADDVGDFAHADQADVGAPEAGIGDRRAGYVKRPERGLFGDQRGEGVVDAGRDHDGLSRQAGAQIVRLRHHCSPR